MTPSSCVRMAEYNRWMNARLYQAAARLSEPDLFLERGAFFGSLFDTLNHIAVGDFIWLQRFALHPELDWMRASMQALPRPAALRQRLAGSLPELRGYRERADQVICEFAAGLSDAMLAHVLQYTNTSGQAHAKEFGALVQHFFNHQTHHRGQASTLLFQAGVDIGVTDLVAIVPDAPLVAVPAEAGSGAGEGRTGRC